MGPYSLIIVFTQCGVESLAGIIFGDFINILHMECGRVEACLQTQQLPDFFCPLLICDEHIHGVILTGTGTVKSLKISFKEPLSLVQPNAIAKDFEKTFFSSHDGEKSILVERSHITGMEPSFSVVTSCEIFATRSIAKGYIFSFIK